jgi:hypothetical protein
LSNSSNEEIVLRLEFFEICREVAEEVKFFETAAFEVFREDEVAELKLAPFAVFTRIRK